MATSAVSETVSTFCHKNSAAGFIVHGLPLPSYLSPTVASTGSGKPMPVTFAVAGQNPAQSVPLTPAFSTPQSFAADIRKRIDKRLPQRHAEATRLLSSSLKPGALTQINPTKNGFVDACITAYNQHHHLVIRPDDIWMAIIAQLSFYVNAHAVELRDRFVPTQKRRKLKVQTEGNAWTVDYAWITRSFLDLMKDNLCDKDLASWILPKFSTTTKFDALCTSVMMMGSLHSYFSYEVMPLCGIPTVTLEGHQADYINILRRIDKLSEFGEETHMWGEMLRPIILRFVLAFNGEPDEFFWNQVCHQTNEMCGNEYYTGWITAFCPFDERGKWQLFTPSVPEHIGHYHIDNVVYQALHISKVSWGFAQVDIKIIEHGVPIDATFVAGLMGLKVSDGPVSESHSSLGLLQNEVNTSISPHPAWFIYEQTPWIPAPTEIPDQLRDLRLFLQQVDSDTSYLTSGVPVLSSPIDFPSLFEPAERIPKVGFVETPVTISSLGGLGQRQSPRKLKKERPWTPPEDMTERGRKESKTWRFPGLRRPLSSTNTRQ